MVPEPELSVGLIPPPDEVGRRLAAVNRERRLLKSLYRLSCRAEQERREHEKYYPRPAAGAAEVSLRA